MPLSALSAESAAPEEQPPSDSALLTGVIDAQVGPIITLIDQLRSVGIDKDIQIPQIAVMGDQSSGKSSVLEALSGIPFPRGSGLVTKCATELRMQKTPGAEWQASISLSKSWPKAQPRDSGKVNSPADLGEKILRLTDALLSARGDEATFEHEHSIVIELSAPDVPDLTVIDLPGIVRTHIQGQSSEVIAQVNHLLDDYLRQERTIILCVIPSNVDIATVDILDRAEKADPEGARTIGVLTKPDTIGEGSEREVLNVLQGIRKPLKLGYLMVKNRSQKQIDEGLTLAEARGLEKTYFKSHEHFGIVHTSYFGIENLMSRLTSVLVSRIQEGLPLMRKEINELKENTIAELAKMGKSPPTKPSEIREVMLGLAQEVAAMVGESEKGVYSNPLFTEHHLRLIARIREEDGPQDKFRESVLKSKPVEKWEVGTLRIEMARMRGRELPGFLNWKVFELLLKQSVKDWREPAFELLKSTTSILEEVCEEIVEKNVPQYHAMSSSMKQIVQDIIEKRAAHVRLVVIDLWLEVESVAFTLQPEFFETYNRMKVDRFAKAYDEMAPTLAQAFVSGQQGATTARDKMIEWYKQSHSVGSRSNEHHEAEDMHMLLESYWKTAVDRAIDSLCMKIDQSMIQNIASEVMKGLVELSLDEHKSVVFFAQDPRIREQRAQLEARLERLSQAQHLISSSM